MLKQVSVYAENKKGCFRDITGLLTDSGINILGSVTNDSAEYGIVRLVVSDPEKARDVLIQNGYLCRLVPVLGIELADEVGSLNRLLTELVESNINVDYLYLSYNRESGMPIMVLHTEGTAQVENILVARGYHAI
ncbi:MAG: amino acid-binding protein [Lachnospiraceae bacterium]|nr:amino acid-binding protein [Lachnospiraceae bacterium]